MSQMRMKWLISLCHVLFMVCISIMACGKSQNCARDIARLIERSDENPILTVIVYLQKFDGSDPVASIQDPCYIEAVHEMCDLLVKAGDNAAMAVDFCGWALTIQTDQRLHRPEYYINTALAKRNNKEYGSAMHFLSIAKLINQNQDMNLLKRLDSITQEMLEDEDMLDTARSLFVVAYHNSKDQTKGRQDLELEDGVVDVVAQSASLTERAILRFVMNSSREAYGISQADAAPAQTLDISTVKLDEPSARGTKAEEEVSIDLSGGLAGIDLDMLEVREEDNGCTIHYIVSIRDVPVYTHFQVEELVALGVSYDCITIANMRDDPFHYAAVLGKPSPRVVNLEQCSFNEEYDYASRDMLPDLCLLRVFASISAEYSLLIEETMLPSAADFVAFFRHGASALEQDASIAFFSGWNEHQQVHVDLKGLFRVSRVDYSMSYDHPLVLFRTRDITRLPVLDIRPSTFSATLHLAVPAGALIVPEASRAIHVPSVRSADMYYTTFPTAESYFVAAHPQELMFDRNININWTLFHDEDMYTDVSTLSTEGYSNFIVDFINKYRAHEGAVSREMKVVEGTTRIVLLDDNFVIHDLDAGWVRLVQEFQMSHHVLQFRPNLFQGTWWLRNSHGELVLVMGTYSPFYKHMSSTKVYEQVEVVSSMSFQGLYASQLENQKFMKKSFASKMQIDKECPIVYTVLTMNRHTYTRMTLRLLHHYGIAEECLFVMNSNRAVPFIAADLPNVSVRSAAACDKKFKKNLKDHPLQASKDYMCLFDTLTSLKLSRKTTYVILEDDLLPATDFASYFQHGREVMLDSSKDDIVVFSAWGDQATLRCASYGSLYRSQQFSGLGWMAKSDFLTSLSQFMRNKSVWNVAWDVLANYLMTDGSGQSFPASVFPDLPRVLHAPHGISDTKGYFDLIHIPTSNDYPSEHAKGDDLCLEDPHPDLLSYKVLKHKAQKKEIRNMLTNHCEQVCVVNAKSATDWVPWTLAKNRYDMRYGIGIGSRMKNLYFGTVLFRDPDTQARSLLVAEYSPFYKDVDKSCAQCRPL